MKLTVLGATGGVGTEVVRQALDAGHRVTAVVRDRARLAVTNHAELDVVTADALNPTELGPAVAGRDAVISALGGSARRPSTVVREGARSVIAAMREAGTRRLLVVSAAGLHTEGDDPFVRTVVKPILNRVLRHPFDDMRAMEALVRDSGLDWTIVSPPRLTDKPRTGRARVSLDRTVRRGFTISRADVADYLLRAVPDESLVGHSAFVAN